MREKAWKNFAKAGEKEGEKNFSPLAVDVWESVALAGENEISIFFQCTVKFAYRG